VRPAGAFEAASGSAAGALGVPEPEVRRLPSRRHHHRLPQRAAPSAATASDAAAGSTRGVAAAGHGWVYRSVRALDGRPSSLMLRRNAMRGAFPDRVEDVHLRGVDWFAHALRDEVGRGGADGGLAPSLRTLRRSPGLVGSRWPGAWPNSPAQPSSRYAARSRAQR
jgi:hypothetical protein